MDLQDRVAKGELPCFPPELCLQVDGASDNKASVMFMFMEWLVRTRVFTSVVVSFLMVGHTHNDTDQQFVPLKYELRKSVIKSLSDYLAAIKTAYKTHQKLSGMCKPYMTSPSGLRWILLRNLQALPAALLMQRGPISSHLS